MSFTNEVTHQVTDVLRLKLNETEEDGVKRLMKRGWIIPKGGYQVDLQKRLLVSSVVPLETQS